MVGGVIIVVIVAAGVVAIGVVGLIECIPVGVETMLRDVASCDDASHTMITIHHHLQTLLHCYIVISNKIVISQQDK